MSAINAGRRRFLVTSASATAGFIIGFHVPLAGRFALAQEAAQAKPALRFAAVFSDKDIRANMMQVFAKEVEGDFKVDLFLNASLFKQGTELVALQRDNLELGNVAPQDISRDRKSVV